MVKIVNGVITRIDSKDFEKSTLVDALIFYATGNVDDGNQARKALEKFKKEKNEEKE